MKKQEHSLKEKMRKTFCKDSHFQKGFFVFQELLLCERVSLNAELPGGGHLPQCRPRRRPRERESILPSPEAAGMVQLQGHHLRVQGPMLSHLLRTASSRY